MASISWEREILTCFDVKPQARSLIDWSKFQIMRLSSISTSWTSLRSHKDSVNFEISSTWTFASTRCYSRIHNRWGNSNHWVDVSQVWSISISPGTISHQLLHGSSNFHHSHSSTSATIDWTNCRWNNPGASTSWC